MTLVRHLLLPPPLRAAPEIEPPPECANAPAGYEQLSVLLRGLLAAVEQRWSGSVVVRGETGQPVAILRCRGGHVVAGRLQSASDVFDSVFSLCSQPGSVDISFTRDVDLVGSGPWVKRAALDTLALTAAVVRSGCADDGAADAMCLIGTRSIIVRANAAFERYLFSKAERAVIDMLVRGPLTLSELARCSPLSHAALTRIIFTLWITRAATPAPTWLRSISGPISHPAPALDQRPDEEQTVAMKSFVRSIGSYSQRSPEHGVMGLWDDAPKQSQASQTAHDEARARADEHFRVAELLLERGHAREAVFEAQLALRLCEPLPEQRALYGWALYQRAGGRGVVPAHVWEHIETALLADPNCQRALQYRALLLQSAPRTSSRR